MILRKILRNSPLIIGQESSSYTQMLNRMLRKKGLSRYEVVARISTLEGMKEITRTGIGIGILPQYIVEGDIRRNTLTRLHVKSGELRANIYLVENTRSVETPTLSAVKNLLMTYMTRSSSPEVLIR
jgi:DNA-binding transcriptional LysR family regulator